MLIVWKPLQDHQHRSIGISKTDVPVQSSIKLFATSRDPDTLLTNLTKLMSSDETTGRLQYVSLSTIHLD
jgi:hypothetical protein